MKACLSCVLACSLVAVLCQRLPTGEQHDRPQALLSGADMHDLYLDLHSKLVCVRVCVCVHAPRGAELSVLTTALACRCYTVCGRLLRALAATCQLCAPNRVE